MSKNDKSRGQKKADGATTRPSAQHSSDDSDDFSATTTSTKTTRSQFLQKLILTPLENINKQTALAPLFSGVSADGEWLLKLKTWKNHEAFKSSSCSWRELKDAGDVDEANYEFSGHHQSRYMNDIDGETVAQYIMICVTTDAVSVPVFENDDLPVTLHGEAKVTVSSTRASGKASATINQVWSASVNIKWSAHINITVGSDGLRAELVPAVVKPDFEMAVYLLYKFLQWATNLMLCIQSMSQ